MMNQNIEAVPTISAQQLHQLLHSKKEILLLDVRENHELHESSGSISGVKNIPLAQLGTHLDALKRDPDRTIVTICRSGGRATKAAQVLRAAGFTDVHVLAGGMQAWNAKTL